MARGDVARAFPEVDPARGAADPPRRRPRRCSCSRARCATRGSRSSSPARAPTRCSPATISSARPRCGASSRGSRARARGRCSSTGSTRGSRAARARRATWPGASSRATPIPTAPLLLASAALSRRGGAARASSRPRCARGSRGDDAVAELTRLAAAAAFASFGPARARAVPGDAHPALGLPALGAGRSREPSRTRSRGAFPFLDSGVVAAAARMPEAHKLHVLDEKHVLKRVAARLVPAEILARPKQPYRAPDAASFFGARRARLRRRAPLRSGAARGRALRSRRASRGSSRSAARAVRGGPLGNADNMAFVGVLSAQLVWHELCRTPPRRVARRSRSGSSIVRERE